MIFCKKLTFIFLFLNISLFGASFPNSYYKVTNSAELKKRFVSIMLPVIKKENAKILRDREFIQNTLGKNLFTLTPDNIKRLVSIKKKYKIARVYDLNAYLRKVDIIPISLAIAQAAIESGWGKSRFAREANNLFGQWTYSGYGMIPEGRPEGATYAIRIFNDLEDSVANYMLNLNMGWAYSEFRNKRFQLRVEKKPLDSDILAQTLLKYSSTGQIYVEKLQTLIKENNLKSYDLAYNNTHTSFI